MIVHSAHHTLSQWLQSLTTVHAVQTEITGGCRASNTGKV